MVYFLTVPCDHTVGQRHSIVKKEAKEKMKKEVGVEGIRRRRKRGKSLGLK